MGMVQGLVQVVVMVMLIVMALIILLMLIMPMLIMVKVIMVKWESGANGRITLKFNFNIVIFFQQPFTLDYQADPIS